MSPDKGKRILFGITKSNFGGAQRYVFDLAVAAKKSGYDTGVVCGGKGLLVEKLKKEKIYPQSLPSLTRDISILGDLKSLKDILGILKSQKPDIFHINSSKMGLGAVAGRIAGIKQIIFTAHGLPYEEDRPWLAKEILKFFTWLTFIFSHQVITISEDNYRKARKMMGIKNKVFLIPNGIQQIDFSEKNQAKEYLSSLAWKPIPQDKIWIGTISELTKNKGLSYAIRGMAQLSHRNWVFIIIGIGEERGSLIKLSQDLGVGENVFFPGFVDNAPRYLKAFDIFTLTSVKEGQPYTLLEASQARLPVLASDLPGIREMVSKNESGLLASPKDIEEIKLSLEKLITDIHLRNRLAENLNTKCADKFSYKKMIDSTLDLYK